MEKKKQADETRVIVNCAMSIDGKIALPSKKQTKISSEEDMARVHRLRNASDAIVVGIGTVLADDPKLTVKEKYVTLPKKPVRVVLDSSLRIPLSAKVLDGAAPTIIAVSEKANKKQKKIKKIERLAADRKVEILICGKEKIDVKKVLAELGKRKINKIMVEGGGTVIWSFLREGVVDELSVYVGPFIIGGAESPTLAGGEGARSFNDIISMKLKRCSKIGNGVLLEYEKPR